MEYTVRTPFLFWLGLVAATGSLAVAVIAFGHWLVMALMLSIIGGCGAALLLMSAEIVGDANGILVRRLHNQSYVAWNDLTSASTGGGNLVLGTAKGRVTLPAFEFWYGAQRDDLITLLDAKLVELQLTLKPSFRALFQAGDR
jgi:hypothetical protein